MHSIDRLSASVGGKPACSCPRLRIPPRTAPAREILRRRARGFTEGDLGLRTRLRAGRRRVFPSRSIWSLERKKESDREDRRRYKKACDRIGEIREQSGLRQAGDDGVVHILWASREEGTIVGLRSRLDKRRLGKPRKLDFLRRLRERDAGRLEMAGRRGRRRQKVNCRRCRQRVTEHTCVSATSRNSSEILTTAVATSNTSPAVPGKTGVATNV